MYFPVGIGLRIALDRDFARARVYPNVGGYPAERDVAAACMRLDGTCWFRNFDVARARLCANVAVDFSELDITGSGSGFYLSANFRKPNVPAARSDVHIASDIGRRDRSRANKEVSRSFNSTYLNVPRAGNGMNFRIRRHSNCVTRSDAARMFAHTADPNKMAFLRNGRIRGHFIKTALP